MDYIQGMDKRAKIGLAAVAAVLAAGLIAGGVTYAVNLQAERDKAVNCAIGLDC